MKVLILVQSFEGDTSTYKEGDLTYSELMRAQQETWDSVVHPDVQTIYYIPSLTKSGFESNKFYVRYRTDFDFMFIHFMKTLIGVMDLEWDYIFKTDNSAYVCKEELVKLLTTKPRSRFYGGHPYDGPNINDIKDFMWGEGVALSRDVVQSLIDIYALDPVSRFGPEDIIIGAVLKDKCEWDPTMKIHVYWHDPFTLSHVYRCRNDQSQENIFSDDIKAMKEIHQKLTE